MGRKENASGFRRFRRPRMPERLSTGRLVLGVVVAGMLYLLVLSDYGIIRRWRLGREAAAVQTRLNELERRRSDIESRREEIGDDAALERIAREEYGMVRSGEHVYRLASPDTVEK